jgi:hypothetical protein
LSKFNGRSPAEVHTYLDADGNPTTAAEAVSVRIEREPDWLDDDREVAIEHDAYTRNVHHACGTHVSKSMDKSVGRKVEREKFVCEDCRAIETARKKFHKDRGHNDDHCDCDEYVFYVSEYVPLPDPTEVR